MKEINSMFRVKDENGKTVSVDVVFEDGSSRNYKIQHNQSCREYVRVNGTKYYENHGSLDARW